MKTPGDRQFKKSFIHFPCDGKLTGAVFAIIIILTFSCGTEEHYFRKSLSKADKVHLQKNDSLVKRFSGKANWYKQYWTGNILVKKKESRLIIEQVGEWRQTSKDGRQLWAITNFDRFGYVDDEIILGEEGMPPVGETHCKRDTVNGQVRQVCEYTNRYANGQLKEKGKKVMVKKYTFDKQGKWEYYTDTGELKEVIEYIDDVPVRKH